MSFVVTVDTELQEGRYRFIDPPFNSFHYDDELPDGQIEIYMHPERGLSYWDDGHDDGTDWCGHACWNILIGKRLERIKVKP